MPVTASLKNSPYMKKCMAQADPPKEASTVKKMNERLLLHFSLNKMTYYFKESTAASGVLKKIYCPYKNLMLRPAIKLT